MHSKAIIAGVLLLTIHPLWWLIGTWASPAYNSEGVWVFAAAAALFTWSITSPRGGHAPDDRRLAVKLLIGTTLARLAGQLLAINILGGLALVFDVYALGLWCGLRHRQRPIAPGWLALAFAFSLPIERVLQRTLGYALQHISASGACGLLSLEYEDLRCEGVRIILAGQEALVDLPCSGARSLLLLLLAFTLLGALKKPTLPQALVGALTTLAAGIVANTLRIAALALFLAFPPEVNGVGIDVMAQPWHDLIGLSALAIGLFLGLGPWALGLGGACWHLPGFANEGDKPTGEATTQAGTPTPNPSPRPKAPSPRKAQWAFLLLAALIIALPGRPIDVAKPIDDLRLPSALGMWTANPAPLSQRETEYFTQYGGAAARATYGPHALLLVRTSAPLRHLHDPSECLASAGHEVQYIGMSASRLPAAVYRAKAPDGRVYRVEVTFASSEGHLTTNISEAVWRWLQRPGTTWTAIQRISPWDLPENQRDTFDEAVGLSLELGTTRDTRHFTFNSPETHNPGGAP